ncbi:unnamed protein product [Rhizoctonia solani]|uniref:NACHT domain-containing protein n=1 Tax=Rhizoctonia solani TaxID=456999 RepID=A0A8H2XNT8_9AGAM|nr:unnamed protein product [Rhizoctonia solani]
MAAETLQEALEAIETNLSETNDIRGMASDLTKWATLLTGFLEENRPVRMSKQMDNLIDALRRGADHLRKQTQGGSTRLAECEQNTRKLEYCHREVEEALRQLLTDASLSIWKNTDKQLKESLINGLLPAHDASYDSSYSDKIERGPCLENTRATVLDVIRKWIYETSEIKVYWINGMAGTGKTTIAYSICEELAKIKKLGASFFVSRASSQCQDVSRILPTIAYQLACVSYPYRSALCRILNEELNLGQRKLSVQFQHLIESPLREVEKDIPQGLVVVIDALDESSNPRTIEIVVETLLRHASDLPVRFFLTSRPEPSIMGTALSNDSRSRSVLHLHNVEEQLVKADVKTYLTVSLARLQPTVEQIELLAEQAGVLFIYAATVVRYILSTGLGVNSTTRLKAILAPSTARASKKDRAIDQLYKVILEGVLEDQEREEHEVMVIKQVLWTVVCAREPVTKETLAMLAQVDYDQVTEALRPLQSVIHVSEGSDIVSTLHASFPEFVLNPSRSGPLSCNRHANHQYLVTRCFSIMDDQLRFNICGLKSSYEFDRDVPNIESRVKEAISSGLFYACRFWAEHLTQATTCDAHFENLNIFLNFQLLFWMEVLNLKGWMQNGQNVLIEAKSWLTTKQRNNALLDDALEFAITFAKNPINSSTPHIYVSQLLLVPKRSSVRQIYLERTQGLVHIKGTAAEMPTTGPLPLAEWEAVTRVAGIAFLPGNTQIIYITIPNNIHAPASRPEPSPFTRAMITVWDVISGRPLTNIPISCVTFTQALRGVGQPLVAFSPDGSRIAYSFSESFYILDTFTGTSLLGPMSRHRDQIHSLDFSPDGSHVASASHNDTLQLWDACNGLPVGDPVEDWTYWATFSSCGARIASWRVHGSIQVRGIPGGVVLTNIPNRHSHAIHSITFSPDGTRLVSKSSDDIIVQDSHNGDRLAGPFRVMGLESIKFTSDDICLACITSGGKIMILDTSTGALYPSPFHMRMDQTTYTFTTISSDRSTIALCSDDNLIQVWYVGSKKASIGKSSPAAHTDRINSITFSPDSTKIATGSYDTIYIWDSFTGLAIIGPLKAHAGLVEALVFSPDGLSLASAHFFDEAIRIWSVNNGTLIHGPFVSHLDAILPISSICFSPDSARIALAEAHSERNFAVRRPPILTVLDIRIGTILNQIDLPDSARSVAFSCDGNFVFSHLFNGTIQVWSISSYTGVPCDIDPAEAWRSGLLSTPVQGVVALRPKWHSDRQAANMIPRVISPKEDTVACGYYVETSTYDKFGLWDTRAKNLLTGPFGREGEEITTFAFSPDGARILVSCQRRVPIWDYTSNGCSSHCLRTWDVRKSPSTDWSGKPWNIDLDGWVRDQDSRPVIWLPTELRQIFPLPPNSLYFGPEGNLSVSMANLLLGESWVECYNPDIPNPSLPVEPYA